jgi:hypothetical protein
MPSPTIATGTDAASGWAADRMQVVCDRLSLAESAKTGLVLDRVCNWARVRPTLANQTRITTFEPSQPQMQRQSTVGLMQSLLRIAELQFSPPRNGMRFCIASRADLPAGLQTLARPCMFRLLHPHGLWLGDVNGD